MTNHTHHKARRDLVAALSLAAADGRHARALLEILAADTPPASITDNLDALAKTLAACARDLKTLSESIQGRI